MVLVHRTSPQWDLSTHELSWMNKGQQLQKNEALGYVSCALHYLLNEIYLPLTFHVDDLHGFKSMLRTKKGRTDESINICHPSGA